MNAPFFHFFAVLYRHPIAALSVILGVIIVLSSQIPRLSLDASADSLVLEGDESLEIYRQVAKRYQAESILVVAYAPDGELYSDEVLSRIAALRDELAAVNGVSSVTSLLDVPLLYSPPVKLRNLSRDIGYLTDPQTNRALARGEFRNSPIYKNLLTSHNADTTALQITLTRDEQFYTLLYARDELRSKQKTTGLTRPERIALKQAEVDFLHYSQNANKKQEKLVAEVRAILDNYRDHANIFLGGVPMIAVDMIDFIGNDLVTFGGGILLFIILMMAMIFRRLRWIVLPLLTCLATTLCMLGFLAWAEWQLTVISSNFTALLLIITLAITIHLVVRYREFHVTRPELSQRALVLHTLSAMAKPCFFTAITTIVAFASLVFSGIRPVIDFGWMMTIGVATALLMAFTLLPLMLFLLPRGKNGTTGEHKPLTHHCARITDNHGTSILVISITLLILSAVGIGQLKVENRFIDYFHDTTEIYRGMVVIDKKLGGTIPLEIILQAPHTAVQTAEEDDPFDNGFDDDTQDDPFGDEEDPFGDAETQQDTQQVPAASYWFTRSGLEELQFIHNYVDKIDETGKVLSLASLYAVLKDIAGEDIDDFQLALLRKNIPEDVNRLLVAPYLSPDGQETRISLRVKETSHSLERQVLLDQIQRFLNEQMGYQTEDLQQTGMLVLYNKMLQSLFRSQITTLGVVFAAITLMFALLFRSLYLALIAVTPNLLAAAMVLGFMGWVGIPLDMMTITIAAITVGIGVDDTIHYIHRFREEFPKDQDYRATMYRCHNSIGRAMFYTSVIIIAGFSILALSNFTPTIYFGLLTGLAMLSALIGALFLLPQLLIVLKPRINT